MIARFIFAETICGYEHSASRYLTKDLKLPEGFIPLQTQGRMEFLSDGTSKNIHDSMDLKGVELIDEGGDNA